MSEAGGIGVVQPISLTYVHGHSLREGLQHIRRLTDKPIGFNALVEQSSRVYLDRMRAWVDIALEEGVRFFVTAPGQARLGGRAGSTRCRAWCTTTSPTGASLSAPSRTASTG